MSRRGPGRGDGADLNAVTEPNLLIVQLLVVI